MGLPIREYLLAGLTAAVITYLLVGPVRALALKLGAVAWPRGRDVHVTPTPRWGGIAMLGGLLGGVLMAYQLPALRLAFDTNTDEVFGAVIAAVVMCVVGILDDRFELDALTKFAGQITATGALLFFGVQWTTIWVPWGGANGTFLSLSQEQGVGLTILLTVGLVNAMNFVDGLDGLAAGLGLITAAATGAFALGIVHRVGNDPSAYSPALMAAVLAGACLGFLPHNFNPARIFMGDSGSMLIGVMLAAATTSASGKVNFDAATSGADLLALFAPLVVLAAVVFVPLLDLLMAVVRRTRKGLSPFAPDKMHLHHRLLEIGHSQRRAVLLIYAWASVLAFGAVAVTIIGNPTVVIVLTAVALLLAALATAIPRLRRLDPKTGIVPPNGVTHPLPLRTGHPGRSDLADTGLSQVRGRKVPR